MPIIITTKPVLFLLPSTDPALVSQLAVEKLDRAAETVRGEGWKWVATACSFGQRGAASTWKQLERRFGGPIPLGPSALVMNIRSRRVLRKRPHGLTASHYKEVFILEGAYYAPQGHILAGPGTIMFNAPGARHGDISCELTLYIHCCSGESDEIVSVDLVDFEPTQPPAPVAITTEDAPKRPWRRSEATMSY